MLQSTYHTPHQPYFVEIQLFVRVRFFIFSHTNVLLVAYFSQINVEVVAAAACCNVAHPAGAAWPALAGAVPYWLSAVAAVHHPWHVDPVVVAPFPAAAAAALHPGEEVQGVRVGVGHRSHHHSGVEEVRSQLVESKAGLTLEAVHLVPACQHSGVEEARSQLVEAVVDHHAHPVEAYASGVLDLACRHSAPSVDRVVRLPVALVVPLEQLPAVLVVPVHRAVRQELPVDLQEDPPMKKHWGCLRTA